MRFPQVAHETLSNELLVFPDLALIASHEVSIRKRSRFKPCQLAIEMITCTFLAFCVCGGYVCVCGGVGG